MFGGVAGVSKGLSFGKVLTGLSKTLSIANQVIPLYQQAKPMIGNAKSAFKLLKEFSKPAEAETVKKEKAVKIDNNIQKKTNTSSSSKVESNRNLPVFFA